jgi:protein gp37
MAENSKIEWTEHTGNFWWGCDHVTAGCDNCYAETFANRYGHKVWGTKAPRLYIKSIFKALAKFQRQAQEQNKVERVFVGSMMDIFEKSLPLYFFNGDKVTSQGSSHHILSGEIRDEFFNRISQGEYQNLFFLLLTKRPSNINKMIPEAWKTSPPANVMFGTSPVDQQTFDNLIPHLLNVNGKRFLSMEPQLAPIGIGKLKGIDWIIQGGESGPHRRPFNLEWADSMREQCAQAGIPYFFKQIDKVIPVPEPYLIRELPIFLKPAA